MLKESWRKYFFKSLNSLEEPPPKDSAGWTAFMGTVLDKVAERMGCYVARRKRGDQYTGEHLGIDAVFFENRAGKKLGYNKYGGDQLVLPRVVVELENGYILDKIAYCLWKLLCIRSRLRVLICYQSNRQKIEALRRHLQDCIRKGGLLAKDIELIILVGNESADDEIPWEQYYLQLEWQDGGLRRAS